MNFWSLDQIKNVLGGTWLARPAGQNGQPPIEGLSIDSRAVKPGQVFLALRGERFDGHDFLAQAVGAGSPLLIVDRDGLAAAGPTCRAAVLRVADTRKALGKLAHAYRRSLEHTKVVAVCGSNGKTTTVRLLTQILETRLRGTASQKSFNNDVGVPLTILSAKPVDQFLICEVGTNAPGEIAALSAIVEPDIAVITSIGREHLAFLNSVEGVAREESAVLGSVRPGGVAVVPADAPHLSEFLKKAPAVVAFGEGGHADVRLTDFVQSLDSEGRPRISFSINGRGAYQAPLAGRHNALNALAAAAVARRFGLDDDYIAAGLASAGGPEMRWQVEAVGGAQIINDAYNANPDSALAAITTFADLFREAAGPWGLRRRVVVIGDMLELGPAAIPAHEEIGDAIARCGAVDVVVTVGELAAATARVVARHWNTQSVQTCGRDSRVVRLLALDDAGAANLAASFGPGDIVLLKGSRRMKLERIVSALRGRPLATTV